MIALPHLRAWRLHALLRRAELGHRAGVNPRTVDRAERGGRVADVTAVRLARALGCTVEQLQSEEPPK
jgi:DNA-binding XRE family transcriptional regulator